MKTLTLALAICALPLSAAAGQASNTAKPAVAQKESIPVTISAKGEEIRKVLMSLFDQEKKQYVIDTDTHYRVFLSLENADFHRTLDILCKLAGLEAELRDGIYWVHTARKIDTKPQPTAAPAPVVHRSAPPAPAKPAALGPVPASALQKHVTTRFTKASIRSLFDELSKQTGVKIVVDDKVPAYKLDAYLINTSLRYALNRVTKAAGLQWKLPPDRTVLITTEGSAKPGTAVIHS